MNVLVVAPHPDDEAIGCGGTLLRHVDAGDAVHVVFLTSGELGLDHLPRGRAREVREEEARRAAELLGLAGVSFLRTPDWGVGDELGDVAEALAALIADQAPQRLYAPHAEEWHPDHRAGHEAAARAIQGDGIPDDGFVRYEVWTPLAQWDTVEDITDVMDRKVDAIRCYSSQLRAFDYVQAATGLGSYRGALASRTAFAEVFRVHDE